MSACSSKRLFAGNVYVHFGQFYVEPDDGDYIGMTQAFLSQKNGICGASQPGRLFLITGTHTGTIQLTVDLHTTRPPLDESWEEVVECSLSHTSSRLFLYEWAHENAHELALPPGTYRVRYNANTMLAEWQTYHIADDALPKQQYCLQFWPDTSGPDEVIKVTGECAAYWHQIALKFS